MAYGTKWTKEEDEILCEFYPVEHGAVAERLPGRSVGSCRARASILGIAQKMDVKPDVWSDNEVKILYEFYPSEGGNVIHRLPGRTVAACRSSSACCSKAHALNIQLGVGRKRRSRKNGNMKK